MTTLFSQEYVTQAYGEEKLQEGRAAGRSEGLEEGRTEGEYSKAVAIAGSLLRAGMDHAFVAEHTGLPLEEVDRLSA